MVIQSSSAEEAGLHAGDTILQVNGCSTEELTHDQVHEAIKRAGEDMCMLVRPGRYDAVLDQELYEILPPPEDLDQPSEVFEPIDGPEPGLPQNMTNHRTPTPCDPSSLPSSKAPTPYDFPFDRSNTSSPYIVPSKPFRAFSAEPADVPPLENPIILNPKYHDNFKHDEEDCFPKTHFKLPISPYYKPDALSKIYTETNYETNENLETQCYDSFGVSEISNQSITKESSILETRTKHDINEEFSNVICDTLNTESTVKESSLTDISKSHIEEKKEQSSDTSVTNVTKTKELRLDTDLSLINIEKTAELVVDESIERAVSVAREIKEEIDVELKSCSEASEFKNIVEDSTQSENISEASKDERNYKTKESEVCEQNEKQVVAKSEKIANSDEASKVISTQKEESSILNKEYAQTENIQFENINVRNTKNVRNVNVHNTVETNDHNVFSEQKAFTIGLQTIPKIRGSLISSQEHYMLLKTFFIHLTDVMVALSRFILTQPAFNEHMVAKDSVEKKSEIMERDSKVSQTIEERMACQESALRETKTSETVQKSVKSQEIVEKELKDSEMQEKRLEREDKIIEKAVKEEERVSTENKEAIERKKTGSEMAQLTEHKSEDLATKMAAVISEFESKTDISEEKSLEIESTKMETKESISKKSEESFTQKHETVASSQELEIEQKTKELSEKSKKHSREGKTMYVATVESHVYTNKDTILDEQFSSSSNSRQSFESVIDAKELKELQNMAEQNKIFSEIQEAKISKSEQTDFLDQARQNVVLEKHSENVMEQIDLKQSEVKESLQSTCQMDIIECEELESKKEEFITQIKEELKKEEIAQEITTQIKQEQIVQTSQAIKETQQIETIESKTLETIDNTMQEINLKQEQIVQQLTTQNEEIQQLSTQLLETIQEQTMIQEIEKQKANRPRKLSLKSSSSSFPSEISTPTPAHVPPTPLTDEYIFRLSCPAPKDPGVPEPPSPPIEEEEDHEDPHIVKKKLIPHIETEIQRMVYPSDDLQAKKEDLLDIERTTSLLASAIDETIKSIEEYKEQVGIDSRRSSDTNRRTSTTELKAMEQNWANVVNEMKINNGKDQEEACDNAEASINVVKGDDVTNQMETLKTKSYEAVLESKVEKTQSEFTEIKQTEISSQTIQNEFKSNAIESSFDQSVLNNEIKIGMNIESDVGDQSTDNQVKSDTIVPGYRPVHFNPDEIVPRYNIDGNGGVKAEQFAQPMVFTTELGEKLGSTRGIVDGLEETVMKPEVADKIGKPGIPGEKVAEIISGESDMMREAHVMGLSRVITSHMARPEDEIDLAKIKPTIDKLKDSEVIKALNEEIIKAKIEAQKKNNKDDKRWTTFLQRPRRPVPSAKFGYQGWTDAQKVSEPYKVKIVKQPKPKIAPDYKPENFETGLLPWEERAKNAPPPPPIEPEEPILIPEELPEYLEAVDPLAESEVPDLEQTGIELPEEIVEEPKQENCIQEETEKDNLEEIIEEVEQEEKEEMENKQLTEQLVTNVQSAVDPNASLEQQLAQMRAQLAALAQLPSVIQQTLEMVTKQFSQICVQETTKTTTEIEEKIVEEVKETKVEEESETLTSHEAHEMVTEHNGMPETESVQEEVQMNNVQEVQNDEVTDEERERMRLEEQAMINEQRRIAKQKKELMDQMELELTSRQVKQHPTPRVGKPKPVFGPITPQERPMVLPGGRKWRKPQDAYNEQIMNETLMSQAEIIKGNAKGSIDNYIVPYEKRINFLKYEKPPVSLEHLKDSDVYKLIHSMEDEPRGVNMRTPVMAECDYIEKCRAMTPCVSRVEDHVDIP